MTGSPPKAVAPGHEPGSATACRSAWPPAQNRLLSWRSTRRVGSTTTTLGPSICCSGCCARGRIPVAEECRRPRDHVAAHPRRHRQPCSTPLLARESVFARSSDGGARDARGSPSSSSPRRAPSWLTRPTARPRRKPRGGGRLSDQALEVLRSSPWPKRADSQPQLCWHRASALGLVHEPTVPRSVKFAGRLGVENQQGPRRRRLIIGRGDRPLRGRTTLHPRAHQSHAPRD